MCGLQTGVRKHSVPEDGRKDGMRKAYRIHGAVSKEQRNSFHLRWSRTTPSYRNPTQRNSSGYIAKKT